MSRQLEEELLRYRQSTLMVGRHFSSSHIQRLSESCRWRSWWSWRDFQWWCPPKSLPKRSHDDGDDITIQRNFYGLYRDLIIDIGQGLGERRNPIMLWYHSPCTRQMLTIKPIRPSIFWTFSDSSFFLFSWTHGGSDNFTTLECLGYVRMVIYGCMYIVIHGYIYMWLCNSPFNKKKTKNCWEKVNNLHEKSENGCSSKWLFHGCQHSITGILRKAD